MLWKTTLIPKSSQALSAPQAVEKRPATLRDRDVAYQLGMTSWFVPSDGQGLSEPALPEGGPVDTLYSGHASRTQGACPQQK